MSKASRSQKGATISVPYPNTHIIHTTVALCFQGIRGLLQHSNYPDVLTPYKNCNRVCIWPSPYTYIFSLISGRLVITNTLRVYVINPTSLCKGRSVHVQHRRSVWLGNIFHLNWCRPRDVKDQLFSTVLHWFILPYPLNITPSIISGVHPSKTHRQNLWIPTVLLLCCTLGDFPYSTWSLWLLLCNYQGSPFRIWYQDGFKACLITNKQTNKTQIHKALAWGRTIIDRNPC